VRCVLSTYAVLFPEFQHGVFVTEDDTQLDAHDMPILALLDDL
jgi:hypothetical protein